MFAELRFNAPDPGPARALAILRACNRALVRAENEKELLDEICRIAVDIGGYRLAWVGFARDDATKSIWPTAIAGPVSYVESVRLSWADDEYGRGPAGISIRTGEPAIARYVQTDPRYAHWRGQLAAHGFGSILGLPLRKDRRTIGGLFIYAPEPDAFGPDEVDLLMELADDLGFGLSTLHLRADRARLAAAVEQTTETISVTDPDGLIVYVNPAFERSSGYLRDEIVGQSLQQVRTGDGDRSADEVRAEALRHGRAWTGTLVNRAKDGRRYEEETVVTPLRDEAGTVVGFVSSGRDVTRERELELAVERDARERALMTAALERIDSSEPPERIASEICTELAALPGLCAAMVIWFESCDAGGEAVVLAARSSMPLSVAVRQRIAPSRAAYIRERAGLGPWAERWHGLPTDDEFSRAVSAAGIEAVACLPLRDGPERFGVLVVGTDDATDVDRLVDRLPGLASFASVTSALLGPALRVRERDHDVWAEVAAVIAGRTVAPAYQPVLDLRSKKVVGYEALSRFPGGPPDQIFGMAERTGLGLELEDVCIEECVAGASDLPPGAWLGLNVSPAYLLDNGRLAERLAATDRDIVLEVTEHARIDDYRAAKAALEALGSHVRLAVDDAGAGFASLRHVLELGPAFIKLDISLVRGIQHDAMRQALVAGIGYFAVKSGARLIAEGIEDEAELASLRMLAVPYGQGYLLGRPGPPPA